MNYVEGKIGKVLLVKLEKGDDLLLSVKKVAEENSIKLTEAHAITIWNALGDPSLKIN